MFFPVLLAEEIEDCSIRRGQLSKARVPSPMVFFVLSRGLSTNIPSLLVMNEWTSLSVDSRDRYFLMCRILYFVQIIKELPQALVTWVDMSRWESNQVPKLRTDGGDGRYLSLADPWFPWFPPLTFWFRLYKEGQIFLRGALMWSLWNWLDCALTAYFILHNP